MGNDIIQARYEALDTIAQRFAQQAEAQRQMERAVAQALAPLQAGGWIGRGSQAFFAEMRGEVSPSLARLVAALEEARTVTGQISTAVREAEMEAARLFAAQGGGDDPYAVNASKKLSDDIRIVGTVDISSGTLFVKGAADGSDISANDVAQGSLGDCYVISSIAAVADSNPELIRKAIRKNADGTYTVTLHEKRGGFLGFGAKYEPVEITVKPELPKGEYRSDGKWVAVEVHAGAGDREIWPQLIEKAYGQLKAGKSDVNSIYSELNEGGYTADVLAALSGSDSQSESPDHFSIDELSAMQKKGYALTLSSLPDYWAFTEDNYRNDTLVRKHAYWIDSVDPVNKTVTVRNPWGYGDSSGYKIEIPYSELEDNFREITINPLGDK